MLGLATLLLLVTIAPIAQSKPNIQSVNVQKPILICAVLSGKTLNVYTADGQLPVSASIKIFNDKGVLVDRGFTNSDGFKAFKAPALPGVYTILAEKSGFSPAETTINIPGNNILGRNA
ncbi:MAG: carboxypeptidase-like regulatory domain-containing protein [Euryarchaeota archaeon]|nr:carboxypeptidase-like regulatory domain-containing protein [Euryarchaeota archaeon]